MPNTDEIFDYVMNSPENTNPAILKSMLNNVEDKSSGPLIVHINGTSSGDEYIYTVDKTAREILASFPNVYMEHIS